MSDWDYDDDDTNQPQQQKAGNGLRQQLEAALKKNKELETRLHDTETRLRTEAVARIIGAKGLKAKVSKLIPTDVEPTDEAITKWLEEWGDVFGIDNLKEEPKPDAPKPPVENSGDDDLSNHEYAQKLAAMAAATGAAGPPMKDEDVMKRLTDPTLDRKGLLEMINAAGGGYGSG